MSVLSFAAVCFMDLAVTSQFCYNVNSIERITECPGGGSSRVIVEFKEGIPVPTRRFNFVYKGPGNTGFYDTLDYVIVFDIKFVDSMESCEVTFP